MSMSNVNHVDEQDIILKRYKCNSSEKISQKFSRWQSKRHISFSKSFQEFIEFSLFFKMCDLDTSHLASLHQHSPDENLSVSNWLLISPKDQQERHSTYSMNQQRDCTFLMCKNCSTSSTDLSKKETQFLWLNIILIWSIMLMHWSILVLKDEIVEDHFCLRVQEKKFLKLRIHIRRKHWEDISRTRKSRILKYKKTVKFDSLLYGMINL